MPRIWTVLFALSLVLAAGFGRTSNAGNEAAVQHDGPRVILAQSDPGKKLPMAQKLRWSDVHDIAVELEKHHPEVDNVNLRYRDLQRWVLELPDFADDPKRANEVILEAIQTAWIELRS